MGNNPWEFGWDAIAAIGQSIGALATFAAVYVALNENKPRVRVTSRHDGKYLADSITFEPIEKVGEIIITVTNCGIVPVQITHIGYRMPHASYSTYEDELKKLPKLLTPGECLEIKFNLLSLNRVGIKSYDVFYAADNRGKIYYHEASKLVKVRRSLWFNVCKYFGKYRKAIKENNKYKTKD